jgi:hypothetical protein
MSVFYVLPPRPVVENSLKELLETLMPNLTLPAGLERGLAEWVQERLTRSNDVFVVFREELPDDLEPIQALREGFGASQDDEVVEVRINDLSSPGSESWCVGAVPAA